jgi:anti-sigma regulatory factor (Ser/Thr protein kinase)
VTTCTHEFAGKPESAREARAWAAQRLDGCPNADDAVLLLSELVANAVRHSASRDGGVVRVRLSIAAGAWVRCEVRDEGPLTLTGSRDHEPLAEDAAPAVTEPGELAETGRGLWLVHELATRAGSNGRGLYWFTLPWHSRPTAGTPGQPGPDGHNTMREDTAMTEPTLEQCPGCSAGPGTDHGDWCDHACCPECGEQLIACSEHAASTRPARWHGLNPKAEVARTLNWWTTAVGIDHLVEDYTRVLFAIALGQVVWDPQAQRYDIGQVDEAAIDAAAVPRTCADKFPNRHVTGGD